jgi:hypothetical protein
MMSIKRLRYTQPPGLTKKVIEVAVTGGWLGNYMQGHNWAGTTIPLPGFILMLFWQPNNQYMPYYRVHEFEHVAQDEAARWWFIALVKYSWQMVKNFAYKKLLKRQESISTAMFNDYMANKFEIEAYAVEDAAFKNGLPEWAKV